MRQPAIAIMFLWAAGCGPLGDLFEVPPEWVDPAPRDDCVHPVEEDLACDAHLPENVRGIHFGKPDGPGREMVDHICTSGCNVMERTGISIGEIDSPSALSPLRVIRRATVVQVERSNLQRLPAFEALQTVWRLKLDMNSRLLDLSGLERLTTANVIDISGNANLVGVSLERLESVGVDAAGGYENMLSLGGNSSLKTIDLKALRVVHGLFRIWVNASLETLGEMNALEEVEDFVILNNEKLRSLEGLNALKSVRGRFVIQDNPLLDHCEIQRLLNQLVEPPREITISGNAAARPCP